ncbi:GrpB family protein [Micromonospora inositola]|uniref:GrpB domain, predicted nucleotidyltransferase, UPF0157 family n=1 Tax=Micromonospora inositola TaxID=47865 RepID=A0A1C5J7U8_9ACTN|nr:GrpB family protein [Micromonospora inositola]SCG66593.1 GrpB domain, predicted nucleotidyltransferase, UPF0157 family [Micromonospora inositola]
MQLSDKQVVQIVPYDPTWPALAAAAIAEVREVLSEVAHEVEHIGSTWRAKPIVDLMAAVEDLGIVEQHEESLGGLGYRPHLNGMLDRLLCVRATDGVRTHILHVVTLASWPTRNQRILRDYLREHPEDAARYAALKQSIAAAGTAPGEYARAETESSAGTAMGVANTARKAVGLP